MECLSVTKWTSASSVMLPRVHSPDRHFERTVGVRLGGPIQLNIWWFGLSLVSHAG